MAYFLGLILACSPAYLIRFNLFGWPTTALEVLIVVFLISIVARLKIKDLSKVTGLGRINYAIGLFVLSAIIATIVSPDKLRALGQLKAFIIEPVLLFYALVLVIKDQRSKIIALRWLFFGASFVSLFGLIQYSTLIHLPLRFWGNGIEPERITSFFDYPNALALYLAPLFGFFFTLAIYNYQLFKQRWIEIVGLGLMLAALVLTFSRGGLFAVILVCGLLVIRRFGFKKTLPAILAVMILLLLLPMVRQRIMLGFSDASALTHFDLWKIGVQKIIQGPIFGNGLHGFWTNNVEYPHNIFLNFWLETGLLGLLSFCWIMWLVFQKHKNKPTVLGLAVGIYLMVLILHGLVDVPYFKNDLSVLFWFVVAIIYI